MGGNHLSAIPQRALAIFDTLKKLEVQENRIEIITEGDFEGLRNLDSLILAHNKLKQIPANVFSHLKQLNSLELEGNSITYVDKDAFFGLEGKVEKNSQKNFIDDDDDDEVGIVSRILELFPHLRHLRAISNLIKLKSFYFHLTRHKN